jgi:hypothetical protein
MEIVIINRIINSKEIKVDAILAVVVDFVGVDIISCRVIESDSCKGVKSNGVTGDGVVVISAEIHPIFFIVGDGVPLYCIAGANDHEAIIRVSSNRISVSNYCPATIFQDKP